MDNHELPENVKKFIFEFIDSVELLDVLLLMSANSQKIWTSEMLSRELRTNVNSIELRLASLQKIKLVEESGTESKGYRYHSQSAELDAIVKEIAILNQTRRHRILQLIFSPIKQIKVLADGFRVTSKKPEGSNK